MSVIRGTIHDGKVVFSTPPGLPEGKEVLVAPAPVSGRARPVAMMTDDQQGDDPDSIAGWLAAFDAIPVAASSPFDDPAVVAWQESMRRVGVRIG